MSRRNRERRALSRLRREMGLDLGDVSTVDYAALAEAIHTTVLSYTGTDGCRDCLTYAIVGCAWLNRITKTPHALAGGHFVSSVKGVGEVHYEHFWIMRGAIGNWTYLDFATRHNATIIRNEFAKTRPDEALAADAIDPGVDVPFYVGNAEDLPWKYLILEESSRFAQREYEHVNKSELVSRLQRNLG